MQQIERTIEHLGPVAAATLKASAVDAFEAFVSPGDVFRHPREVLAYPNLSPAEKRAILASWASDARAVESCPTLRCLPGCRAEPVPLHEILDALQALDGHELAQPVGETLIPRSRPSLARWRHSGLASAQRGLN